MLYNVMRLLLDIEGRFFEITHNYSDNDNSNVVEF